MIDRFIRFQTKEAVLNQCFPDSRCVSLTEHLDLGNSTVNKHVNNC